MRRQLNIGLIALLVLALASVTFATSNPDRAGAQAADAAELSGWVLSADGVVTALGGAPTFGDASDAGSPAVAIEPTSTGFGYYIALADGTVLAPAPDRQKPLIALTGPAGLESTVLKLPL